MSYSFLLYRKSDSVFIHSFCLWFILELWPYFPGLCSRILFPSILHVMVCIYYPQTLKSIPDFPSPHPLGNQQPFTLDKPTHIPISPFSSFVMFSLWVLPISLPVNYEHVYQPAKVVTAKGGNSNQVPRHAVTECWGCALENVKSSLLRFLTRSIFRFHRK